jgi:hypothetical protein
MCKLEIFLLFKSFLHALHCEGLFEKILFKISLELIWIYYKIISKLYSNLSSQTMIEINSSTWSLSDILNDYWYPLVFWMICWFNIHNFIFAWFSFFEKGLDYLWVVENKWHFT